MSEDQGKTPERPIEDLESQVDSISRELNYLAATRPLWSTAINAQMQRSFNEIASQAAISAFPGERWQQLMQQMASVRLIDTDAFRTSIEAAIGTSGFHEALRINFLPSFKALTKASYYATPDPPKASYSAAMVSPGAYFANDESTIDSFDTLNRSIAALIRKVPNLRLVWRGHRDAQWGIHSALFRNLMLRNGVQAPDSKPRPTLTQPYPDENQMVAAETAILHAARADWRFDGMTALETFARIQHAGGPTRLLDVTKNPFVGAWFAVEQDETTDSSDGRLIAFATTPVLGTTATTGSTQVELDVEWGDRTPPWHLWTDPTARQSVDWGTGARRRLWIPPAYDPRISAQNAAFLLDGTPITTGRTRSYFKSGGEPGAVTYWSRADLLAAGSIYVKTFKAGRRPRPNQFNFAPTFTFRITAGAKEEIREILVSRFGYTRSYIYPDIVALADFVKQMELPALGT